MHFIQNYLTDESGRGTLLFGSWHRSATDRKGYPMICRVALSAVVLVGAAGLVWGEDAITSPRSQPHPSKPDRSFGTALQWEKSLDTASKKAERERKLLLVLAVAGHFEDPFFT